MASGHVNRANRPNTWVHRPNLQREDSPCQLGAVHTWHIAEVATEFQCPLLGVKRTSHRHATMSDFDWHWRGMGAPSLGPPEAYERQ